MLTWRADPSALSFLVLFCFIRGYDYDPSVLCNAVLAAARVTSADHTPLVDQATGQREKRQSTLADGPVARADLTFFGVIGLRDNGRYHQASRTKHLEVS